ncbi:MAG: sulfofructose kinase [Alphaproteobacteria bacterium]|nr:sulfofructose kinase [Alphaproteobacteria bacterium]
MTSDNARAPQAPAILCTGIIVLDEVFQVESFPQPDGKVVAKGFFAVNGGCAANAAVAIARLGARAFLAGPLGGPAGTDENGDRVLAALARERVDCTGCQRLPGMSTALSAIFIDARGDRMIVTYRDDRLAAVTPADPAGLVASVDAVLADNRYPLFVRPICAAARERGLIVMLDADNPTDVSDPLFRLATHVVFSAECLRGTTGIDDLGAALMRIAGVTDAFLAVTNGPQDVLWIDRGALRTSPVFPIKAVDTLGAGDAFHGAFTLALVEGQEPAAAMRFAAATAALKCTRSGGSAAAPTRAEVEALLARA